jgi:nucleoside-diphosphate-sugar epimerase
VLKRILVLGAGYTGSEVVRRARALGLDVMASVRRAEQAGALSALGAEPLVLPELDRSIGDHIDAQTHVVVTFPPDGTTDARVVEGLSHAGAITYVSTTSVYGALQGHIDDETPTPEASADTAPRLAAEAAYRAAGGCILRCPGIYGSDRGLHLRVLRGQYALPGDGSGMLSRIHVYDLASFIFASQRAPGETFVVGDHEPATHLEVVSYVCAAYGVPFPHSVDSDQVHRTLRANRAIDSQRARRVLAVELRYPTFREGMAPPVGAP